MYDLSRAPGSPARPGSVSAACVLLHLLALSQCLSLGLIIARARHYDALKITAIFAEAGYDRDIAEAAGELAFNFLYVRGGLAVFFGAGFLILAVFVGKGRLWALVFTWVMSGLSLCWGTYRLAHGALARAVDTGSGNAKTAGEGLAGLVPHWMEPAENWLWIGVILANVAVMVLLLMPSSNSFFREPDPLPFRPGPFRG